MLADIEADSKRRGETATTLEAKIDGDTLYLWAYYLKDSYNRGLLCKEMKTQFEDCNFYRVCMGRHYSLPAYIEVEEYLNLGAIHHVKNRRELEIFERVWGRCPHIRQRLEKQERAQYLIDRKTKTTWECQP